MTEEEEMTCCDKFNNILDKYQRHSGKISICLSIIGGVSAILVGKFIIAGSIAIAITNASLFFSGLMTEQIVNKKNIVENENKSLKDEMTRKMTLIDNFKFPQTPQTPRSNTPISAISEETQYEPIYEIKINK